MAVVGVLVSLLLTVGPIVLVVYLVRQLSRRSGEGAGVDGTHVRRFFHYGLLLALVLLATSGVADLLGLPFAPGTVVTGDRSDLARALAFTVFGVPMVAGLAWWSHRRMRADPAESHSVSWLVYVTVTALVALVVAMVAAQDLLGRLLGPTGAEGRAAATFVVWTAVWWVHWVLDRRTLDEPRRQGHLAVGSLVGLVVAVTGLVQLLGAVVQQLLDQQVVLVPGSDAVASAAASVLVGLLVWARYWLVSYRHARESGLWLAYVLPVGVGGSLVLALVGGTTAAYQALVWLWGEPADAGAAAHFRTTPLAVACVVVGAASWWYHRRVLATTTRHRSEVSRVHEYLMAGIALVAAAVGVALVVVAAIDALVGSTEVVGGWSVANGLIGGVTVLVIGGALWWAYWSRIQRAARQDPGTELPAPTRRVYLYLLFGVGGVAAVVAVLAAAFIGLQGALREGWSAGVVRDMRVPIAVLIAAAAVSAYHGAVYREDRTHLPARPAHPPVPGPGSGPRHVVLVGAPDPAVRDAVVRRTGARVDLWQPVDGPCGPWDVEEVLLRLTAESSPTVLVVRTADGLEVTPLRPV